MKRWNVGFAGTIRARETQCASFARVSYWKKFSSHSIPRDLDNAVGRNAIPTVLSPISTYEVLET